jgi:hypothetical protein
VVTLISFWFPAIEQLPDKQTQSINALCIIDAFLPTVIKLISAALLAWCHE